MSSSPSGEGSSKRLRDVDLEGDGKDRESSSGKVDDPKEETVASVAGKEEEEGDRNTATASSPHPPASRSSTSDNTSTSDTIYVGGLPNHYCTETVIEKIFAPHGTIQRINVVTRESSSSSSSGGGSFAFCQFATAHEATRAISAVNGRLLGGRRLWVRPAHSKPGGESPSRTAGAAPAHHSPKRQKQQIESRIEAIQKKLKQKQQMSSDNT